MQRRPRAVDFVKTLLVVGLVSLFWPGFSQGSTDGDRQHDRLRVPGEAYDGGVGTTKGLAGARLRQDYSRIPIGFEIVLGPLDPARKRALLDRKAEPLQVGVNRELPSAFDRRLSAADFDWNRLDSGWSTSVAVHATGAEALRLGLRASRLPVDTEIRFFSTHRPSIAFGPYSPQQILAPDSTAAVAPTTASSGGVLYWSPVIDGASIGMEIFVPGPQLPSDLSLSLESVSHLLVSPVDPGLFNAIGLQSGPCEIDVACEPAWLQAGASVAKMLFTDQGGTFTCTGQLLADTDPGTTIPYFATANHCIGSQAAANTLNLIWFFRRAQCDGSQDTPTVQTAGGADLLVTRSVITSTDFSLLRLRQSPPAGVNFSGWSRNRVSVNDDVTGIHHPAGDVKKISQGSVRGLEPWNLQTFDSHIRVRWMSGVTEPGSSGSGLWIGQTWPDQFLVGVLTGGSSSCDSPSASDLYGRFDRTFSALRPFLDPDTGPGPSPPGRTRNLSATSNGDLVRLRWSAPTGGGAPTFYRVHAATEPGKSDLGTFDTQDASTGVDLSIRLPRGTYYFRVSAHNAAGRGADSNEVSLRVAGSGTGACTTIPGSPRSLEARRLGDRLEIHWDADPEGRIPRRWRVKVSSRAGGDDVAVLETESPGATLKVSAQRASPLFIQVIAVDFCGLSAPASLEVVSPGGATSPGDGG